MRTLGKWVIVNKDKITSKDQKTNDCGILWYDEANDVTSKQCVIRLNEDNEVKFTNYVKHTKEDIIAARATFSILKEEHGYFTVTEQNAFARSVLPDGQKLFKRIHGMGSLTLNAGATGELELEINYDWVKLEGVAIMDQLDPISANFYIKDATAGTYSGVSKKIMNQYGMDVNIPENFFEKKSNFESNLYLGMWIVIEITNHSALTQTIRANVELNEVCK